MTLNAVIKARVDPDTKTLFEAAAVSRGTCSSDALRSLIDGYLGAVERSVMRAQPATGMVKGKRWKVVNTRLTGSEWRALERLIEQESETITRWLLRVIREYIVTGPQLRQDELQAVENATYQLRSIGRNLNQMVRAINEGKSERGEFSELYATRLSGHISELTDRLNTLIAAASERNID